MVSSPSHSVSSDDIRLSIMYSSDKSALEKYMQILEDDEAKAVNVVAAALNEDD